MCHLRRVELVVLCLEASAFSRVVPISRRRAIRVSDLCIATDDTHKRWTHHRCISRLELAAEDVVGDYKVLNRFLVFILHSERTIDCRIDLLLLMASVVVRARDEVLLRLFDLWRELPCWRIIQKLSPISCAKEVWRRVLVDI